MKANKLFMRTQLAGPGMETNARTIITKSDAISFLNLISDSERYFGKLYQQI